MPPSPGLTAEALLAPKLEARIVPGLDRISRALQACGNPQERYPSVLVVGTNGKGSTAAFLASLFQAHGLRVGLYTSPHLVQLEERIRIDGEPIAAPCLAQLLAQLPRFFELSYFEALTAAAFLAFAREKVDVAVVEAGLGGRWDATNVKAHPLALLTNVGTDHRGWLGPTRAHIAAEKAAALRGELAIVGQWDPEIQPIIRAHAHPTTTLSVPQDWLQLEVSGPDPLGHFRLGFSWERETFSARLPLSGQFQVANAHLALAAACAAAHMGLVPPLRGSLLALGLEATRWPGRLQLVQWKGKKFLLDGAHNQEAVAALGQSLHFLKLSQPLDLIFSCLADKPLAAMATILRPLVRQVSVVPLGGPRGRVVGELAAAFPGAKRFSTVKEALAAASPEAYTLITGSLRLVGEASKVWGGEG